MIRAKGRTVLAAAVLVISAAAASSWSSYASTLQSSARRTIWNGVYTEEQAKRGKEVYDTHCGNCHAFDMTGINGPTLKGQEFFDHWREDTLNNLYSRLKQTMPQRAPASLTDQQYLDLVAYLLQANSIPAGRTELRTAALADIQFVGRNGPAPVPDFALVHMVGCFNQDPAQQWVLTNASVPARTRNPVASSQAEIRASRAKALGKDTYKLLDVDFFSSDFKAASHKGHKMEAKGFLIRRPDLRLSVTWLTMLDAKCTG